MIPQKVIALLFMFSGMFLMSLSSRVLATDQTYYSRPIPILDSLTGLWVYDSPDVKAQYQGGDEQWHSDRELLRSSYLKKFGSTDTLLTSYCIQFVVTTSGEIVGARVMERKGLKKNGLEKYIVDQINNHGALNKWTPATVRGKKVNQLITVLVVY